MSDVNHLKTTLREVIEACPERVTVEELFHVKMLQEEKK